MLPLPHMSQITAYPNSTLSVIAQRAILRCCNSCCHLPATMTSHEAKSHKKQMQTRKQNTDEKRRQKKLRLLDPLQPATTPPVVTQTQEDSPVESPQAIVTVIDNDSPSGATGVDDGCTSPADLRALALLSFVSWSSTSVLLIGIGDCTDALLATSAWLLGD